MEIRAASAGNTAPELKRPRKKDPCVQTGCQQPGYLFYYETGQMPDHAHNSLPTGEVLPAPPPLTPQGAPREPHSTATGMWQGCAGAIWLRGGADLTLKQQHKE